MEDSLVGLESEEAYTLQVGTIKGFSTFGFEFQITSLPFPLNSAFESTDFIIQPMLTLGINSEPVDVGITFRVDDVALEYDETALLELNEFSRFTVTPGFEPVFIRRHIEVTIVDVNGTVLVYLPVLPN